MKIFKNSAKCRIFRKPYEEGGMKVKDHGHSMRNIEGPWIKNVI